MGVRSTLPSTGYSFEIPPGTYAPTWNEQQIIYVGKHGNDANTGQSIYDAKLTIQAGITQAVANGAVVGNPFSVVGLDGGVYVEDIAMAEYVHVYLPNATLTGAIIGAANTILTLHQQNVVTATIGYLRNTAGRSHYRFGTITCAGTGIGVLATNVAAVIIYEGDILSIENGFCIGNLTTSTGYIHVVLQDIEISGAGIAIAGWGAGTTYCHVDHIANVGAGTGTAISTVGAGGAAIITLYTQEITTTVAWNLAAGTTLRGFLARLNTGTRTVAAAAFIGLDIANYGMPYGDVKTVTNATSPLVLLDTDSTMLIDCTGGAADAQLPLALGRRNQQFEIKWTVAGGAARAIPSGADTIDGAAAYVFGTVLDAITVQSDGVSNWRII